MLAALIEAGRQAQHFVLGKSRCRHGAVKSRFAFRQRAGLVHDQRVHLAEVLDCRRVSEQHTLRRCLAGGDHDGHRRGQTQRARAGNDEHRHGIDQAEHPARLRPEHAPHDKGQQRDADDSHDKVARHLVGHALHRCLGPLRLHDHLHDAREHGLRADFLGTHHQRAVGVQRRADQLVTDALGHRYRFPGQHGLVHRAAALQHDTIDRHLFTRPHAQRITDMDVGQWHILFGAIGVDAPRRLGRQAEQRLDRRRGLRTRLEFEQLPEQRQRNDHRRSLEIDRHPTHRDERRGEHAGRHRSDHAVQESRRRAQADQRPHVRAAMHHGLHCALEERPACPQHDGQGEHQLDPALRGHLEPPHPVTGHRKHRDDDRQRQRPDEAPPEVRQLGVLALVERGHLGLQRHAALRAGAGVILPHLGVHGAGIDGADNGGCRDGRGCRHWSRGRRSCGGHVPGRIGCEFGLATRAAKVEGMPFVLQRMRRLSGHRHAADRVFRGLGRLGGRAYFGRTAARARCRCGCVCCLLHGARMGGFIHRVLLLSPGIHTA